ncbi:hypothetical protein Lal_00023272 [Lupinus albus]|uniref:Putative tetratricopeptide-like helical domain-containing protein n=1 Tax=Lupinus albus TaxID=3870 RepID=A0A6A5N1R0_LUPAL|nr:putative tetratricopeptide-like helical domain-containing protein [Lupinus albus]KAF1881236.1 hypothetical protein Lal_00023272 [Lupinus albus]
MILVRSSSTPVLGSLLSSFNDTSSNNIHHSEASHFALFHLPPTCVLQQNQHHKLSVHQSLSTFSCSSSPISPSNGDFERQNKGFRRAQSEGNLEELAFNSFNNKEDKSSYLHTPTRFSARHKYLALEEEDEEMESDIEDEEEEIRAIEGRVVGTGSGMVLSEEDRVKDVIRGLSFNEVGGKEMYLARGLGIDVYGDGIGGHRGGGGGGGRGGGGGDYNSISSGGNDGNMQGVEEYYKKMVEENPGNPLFLRNYAQFLYQNKEDPEGAEEYYSRAILADPKDGEVLSQYGKLVWELHHDQERASSYFERAVQASPEDSHVHAAYASFLWDTEESEDSCDMSQCLPPRFHHGALAIAGA